MRAPRPHWPACVSGGAGDKPAWLGGLVSVLQREDGGPLWELRQVWASHSGRAPRGGWHEGPGSEGRGAMGWARSP